MLRRVAFNVSNLQHTAAYLSKVFGLQVQRQTAELASLSFADALSHTAFARADVEAKASHKSSEAERPQAAFAVDLHQLPASEGSLDIGEAFGHVALACTDAYKMCEEVKANGGRVTREAGQVKGGQSVIAFVADPDNYKYELIQRSHTPDPFLHVMVRVGDLELSKRFLCDVLGMRVLRETQRSDYKYDLAFVGYGPEDTHVVLELTYNYGVSSYRHGNGMRHYVITCSDIAAVLSRLERFNAEAQHANASQSQVLQGPAALPADHPFFPGALACTIRDLNGYHMLLVQDVS